MWLDQRNADTWIILHFRLERSNLARDILDDDPRTPRNRYPFQTEEIHKNCKGAETSALINSRASKIFFLFEFFKQNVRKWWEFLIKSALVFNRDLIIRCIHAHTDYSFIKCTTIPTSMFDKWENIETAFGGIVKNWNCFINLVGKNVCIFNYRK